MSKEEEREENGFDLATGGGLIRPAFGVGLIRPPVVVYVGLIVMVAYVELGSKMMMMLNLVWAWFGDDNDGGLCGFDFFVVFSNKAS
ncbi:hypothetical protein Q3G72_030169 [Acer saccharum]|nr:hypothetical protein Q3G72_030169 [Acer saccharum]